MKTIGLTVTYFVFLACSVVVGGYTIATLWAWFVVDLFTAPELTVPQAAGLSLLPGYLLLRTSEADTEKPVGELLGKGFLALFIKAGLTLLVGYCVTFFL